MLAEWLAEWWPLLRPAVTGFVVAYLWATYVSRAILRENATLRKQLKDARSVRAYWAFSAHHGAETYGVTDLDTAKAEGRAEGFDNGWKACETANGVKTK